MLSLDDLTETWPDELTPATERAPATERQRDWARVGVVIAPGLFPENDPVLAAYEAEWLAANGGPDAIPGQPATYTAPGGWPYATPYMDHPALQRLVCDGRIAALLEELLGEPAGVHLNLTGWVSTRRNFHRDSYLNPPGVVGGFYAAVWLALAPVKRDAGPFQYVPGSHLGPPLSQARVRAELGADGDGPDWPTHSERILTPLFERQIKADKQKIASNIGMRRGDLLIWHGRLLHRGSVPKNPALERRALIAHYSGVHHRTDMPTAVRHGAGGWYFPLAGRTPTAYGTTR